MKRLSAWTRLWLLFTLLVWSIGGWWCATNLRWPPTTVTAEAACSYYIGTAPNDHFDHVRRCLADPAIEAEARERYLSNARDFFFLFTLPWVFAPFVVASLFVAIKAVVLVIRRL